MALPMTSFHGFLVDDQGALKTNALITITNYDDELSSFFYDADGNFTAQNPITIAAGSRLSYYFDVGLYKIDVLDLNDDTHQFYELTVEEESESSDLYLYENVILDSNGVPVSNGYVTVKKSNGALPNLYVNETGTIAAQNPFMANDAGEVLFWVAQGVYDFFVSSMNASAIFRDVAVPMMELSYVEPEPSPEPDIYSMNVTIVPYMYGFEWESGTTFFEGIEASVGGESGTSYKSKTTNINKYPPTNPTDWDNKGANIWSSGSPVNEFVRQSCGVSYPQNSDGAFPGYFHYAPDEYGFPYSSNVKIGNINNSYYETATYVFAIFEGMPSSTRFILKDDWGYEFDTNDATYGNILGDLGWYWTLPYHSIPLFLQPGGRTVTITIYS